jgi:acyl carrier protein
MSQTLYRLSGILRETLDLEDIEIRADTSRDDLENWDSVAHVELVLAIESEFEVSLTPDEIGEIAGVRDILDILERRGVGG